MLQERNCRKLFSYLWCKSSVYITQVVKDKRSGWVWLHQVGRCDSGFSILGQDWTRYLQGLQIYRWINLDLSCKWSTSWILQCKVPINDDLKEHSEFSSESEWSGLYFECFHFGIALGSTLLLRVVNAHQASSQFCVKRVISSCNKMLVFIIL